MNKAPLAAPDLISPDDEATLNDRTPTFTWSQVGPVGVPYELHIGDSANFDDPLVLEIVRFATDFTMPDTQPLDDGEYFWKVRRVASGGDVGPFSVVRSFTIEGPAPEPEPQSDIRITSPVDSASISPVFFTNTPLITVEGTVADVFKIEVFGITVNGVVATFEGGNNWKATDVPLSENENAIKATALETSGATSAAVIQVVLDTILPNIAITTEDGLVTTEDSISIFGNVHDAVKGAVNDVAVVVKGAFPATVENSRFTALDIPLNIGPNIIKAVATDPVGNEDEDEITVTRVANVAAVRVVGEGVQSATINTPLPNPLVAQMTDSTGAALANREVIFTVDEGDGTITSPTVPDPRRSIIEITDSEGKAQVFFTLGSRSGSGNNRVKAVSTGVEVEATFIASANPRPPDKVNIASGNNQQGAVGQPLAHPFVAIATDDGDNRIEDADLTFTVIAGGGTFSGLSEVILKTDSDGRAGVFLTLGPNPGLENNQVEVTFEGQTSQLPAVFRATAFIPGAPEDTVVSGVVMDNSNVPIQGVTVSVEGFASTPDSQSVTDDQGVFRLKFPGDAIPIGFHHIIADGTTVDTGDPDVSFPKLKFEIDLIPGVLNTLQGPIYLLPLEGEAKLAGGAEDVTFTLENVPGFSFTVLAGSAQFSDGTTENLVSVTQVHGDKVPMVPPNGMQWQLVVTIQPPTVQFDPPAPFTLPNIDGLPPGAKVEMFSFDHDFGDFVSIGTGTVSENGAIVASDPGFGIVKGGWHGGGGPSGPGGGGGPGGGY